MFARSAALAMFVAAVSAFQTPAPIGLRSRMTVSAQRPVQR